MTTGDVNWRLAAAVAVGSLLVVLTALLGDAAGLEGAAAFAAPLLVGVVAAVGIRIGYG